MLLLFYLLLHAVVSQTIFNLYKHPPSGSARCLDGSPAALYIQLGTNLNKNKFLIMMSGGGVCSGITLTDTLEDCYQRSLTDYGSSKGYP